MKHKPMKLVWVVFAPAANGSPNLADRAVAAFRHNQEASAREYASRIHGGYAIATKVPK